MYVKYYLFRFEEVINYTGGGLNIGIVVVVR